MLLKNSITEDKTIWAGLNHPELPLEEADIAVFGIPYDGGVSFRSGTCEAPQELRKITHTISPTTELSHVGDSDHLYFLGIRSIESDELEFYQNNKINVLSAADVDHLGVPAALERMVSHMKRFSKVYITLDIDCLDPAYAAGTGTPQFGGLTARQLLDLLKGLFDGLNIIGMDVVEVAPRLDPSLAALFAARKIITECWARHYFKNLARA